jgi:competence protein ComEC
VAEGNAETPAERAMLAAAPDLDCDVLRTGHHGSGRGTGAEFLAATTPAVAVISCGRRNPYGHPHPDVLSRLAAAGVRTLRTDALGAVTLETDGWTLWISTGGEEN